VRRDVVVLHRSHSVQRRTAWNHSTDRRRLAVHLVTHRQTDIHRDIHRQTNTNKHTASEVMLTDGKTTLSVTKLLSYSLTIHNKFTLPSSAMFFTDSLWCCIFSTVTEPLYFRIQNRAIRSHHGWYKVLTWIDIQKDAAMLTQSFKEGCNAYAEALTWSPNTSSGTRSSTTVDAFTPLAKHVLNQVALRTVDWTVNIVFLLWRIAALYQQHTMNSFCQCFVHQELSVWIPQRKVSLDKTFVQLFRNESIHNCWLQESATVQDIMLTTLSYAVHDKLTRHIISYHIVVT